MLTTALQRNQNDCKICLPENDQGLNIIFTKLFLEKLAAGSHYDLVNLDVVSLKYLEFKDKSINFYSSINPCDVVYSSYLYIIFSLLLFDIFYMKILPISLFQGLRIGGKSRRTHMVSRQCAYPYRLLSAPICLPAKCLYFEMLVQLKK